MLWLLLLTLPCLGGSTPGTPGLEKEGIVGGSPVTGSDFPWQVSLRVFQPSTQRWVHTCGGSLIYSRWVLTAAHCLVWCMVPLPNSTSQECLFWTEMKASEIRVQMGRLRLYEEDEKLSEVVHIIRHPGYNRRLGTNSGSDIALLKLKGPLRGVRKIPVGLPPASLNVLARKMCWVTGWGDVAWNRPLLYPYQLQKVEVPIVGNEECNRMYQNTIMHSKVIQPSMLCAGRAGKNTCEGDSGGPLVCRWNNKWVQVGVVSWGKSCGHGGYPGVFTRVTSFLSWIYYNIHKFSGP